MKLSGVVAILACIASLLALGQAATRTLDVTVLGGGTVSWTDTATWIGGVVPTSADDVVIGTCGISTQCGSGGSSQTTIDFGSGDLTLRSLTLAKDDVILSGTGDLILTNAFTFTSGFISAANVRVQTTGTISPGTGASGSSSHTQTFVGNTNLINTGTTTVSSLKTFFTGNNVISNAAGATLRLRPNFAVEGSVSATYAYFGTPADGWTYHGDTQPTVFPTLDNAGSLVIDSGRILAYGRREEYVLRTYLKSTGTLQVTTNVTAGFYRPRAVVDSTATPTPTITDVYGGTWTLLSNLIISGGVASFEPSFDLRSTGVGILQLGDRGDCAWLTGSMNSIMTYYTISSDVTLGGRISAGGCGHWVGTNKFTFSNLTILSGRFYAPMEVTANLTILPSEDISREITEVFSSFTVSGYASFRRGPSMYDDDNLKLGPSASLTFTSTSYLDMQWLEIFPLDSANVGSARITIDGTARFVERNYMGSWEVPMTFGSTAVLRAGSATRRTSFFGTVWRLDSGGTFGGRFDFTEFVDVALVGPWTWQNSVTFNSPTNGIHPVTYFAKSALTLAGRTLTVPGNLPLGSVYVSGNNARMSAPTSQVVTFNNFELKSELTLCCAGTLYRFMNYSKWDFINSNDVVLEGSSVVNEGVMDLSSRFQQNTNINTRGTLVNRGTIIGRISGGTPTDSDLQLVNYGTIIANNMDTGGIISNGTIDAVKRMRVSGAFVLLPTSRFIVYVTSPTEMTDLYYQGGYWCHLQGRLTVNFITDTLGSPWSANAGMSWNMISVNNRQQCIGSFSEIVVNGLGSGLSVKLEYVDSNPPVYTLTICNTGSAGCGAHAGYTQSSTGPFFDRKYLTLIPPGMYTPPAGTVFSTPAALDAQEPSILASSASSNALFTIVALAAVLIAILF